MEYSAGNDLEKLNSSKLHFIRDQYVKSDVDGPSDYLTELLPIFRRRKPATIFFGPGYKMMEPSLLTG